VAMQQCQWGDHIYRAAPSKSRAGFVASACVRCGKFLGRCPLDEFGCGPGEPAPGGRYMDDQPEFVRAMKKPKRSLRPMLD
jgi:hypothetical protein